MQAIRTTCHKDGVDWCDWCHAPLSEGAALYFPRAPAYRGYGFCSIPHMNRFIQELTALDAERRGALASRVFDRGGP